MNEYFPFFKLFHVLQISLAVDLCSLSARIEDHCPSNSKPILPNLSFHSHVPRCVEPVSNKHFLTVPNLTFEHFPSKPIVGDSNVESSRCSSANEYENLRYFQNSRFVTNSSDANEYDVLPLSKPDIIDEVDTFLENYEKLKDEIDARARIRSERRDNIGTVISKLFTQTDDSVDRKPIKSIRDQSTCTNVVEEYDTKTWPQSLTTRASAVSPVCDFERKTNGIESVE